MVWRVWRVVWLACIYMGLRATGLSANPLQCAPCDTHRCPRSALDCLRGVVPDPCSCCSLGVCRLEDGDTCIEQSQKLTSDWQKYGVCGEDMTCVPRTDLLPEDPPESLCTCNDLTPVCGVSNTTYDNTCALRAAGDGLRSHEPCPGEPEIVSWPAGTEAEEGRDLSLDCEVKGFPVPAVFWEFQGLDGSVKALPGDDLAVSIQSRGGPETYMTTAWVQIVSLRPSDAGTYICIAENDLGTVRAAATVTVTSLVA